MADLRAVARRKAMKYGLDPDIFVRQIQAESGFNPRVRSPKGAAGVAQIMPDTARAWGVDPMRPREALDAAARNMAQYVRKYGSYENALRAYNAGPGAIRASRGYAETNNYVAKILGGKDPKRLGRPRRGGGGGGGGIPGTPGFGIPGTPIQQNYTPAAPRTLSEPSGNALQAVQALLAQQTAPTPPPIGGVAPLPFAARAVMPAGYAPPASSGAPSPPRLDVGAVLDAASTPGQGLDPVQTGSLSVTPGTPGVYVPGQRGSGQRPARGREKAIGRGRILEMYYDKGINVDEGRRTGPIGGHGGHVHVAFDNPQAVLGAAKLAKRLGLRVGENPAFDPVDPVHTQGSFHYQKFKGRNLGKALDVSGDPKKLRRFNQIIAQRYGIR